VSRLHELGLLQLLFRMPHLRSVRITVHSFHLFVIHADVLCATRSRWLSKTSSRFSCPISSASHPGRLQWRFEYSCTLSFLGFLVTLFFCQVDSNGGQNILLYLFLQLCRHFLSALLCQVNSNGGSSMLAISFHDTSTCMLHALHSIFYLFSSGHFSSLFALNLLSTRSLFS
jgi:hypothetical protein